jgi:hypothetical protein
MRASKFLAIVLSLFTLALPLRAADKEEDPEKMSPSPDGRFAFKAKPLPDSDNEKSVDLVDQKSGKAVLRIEDENRYGWHVQWSADSQRFAELSRVSHMFQGVTVYVRSGQTFRKLKLPDFEATIPARMKRGKSYPHTASENFVSASAWKKDGSLVLTIDTMIDGGNAGSITATRTVVLGFDEKGKVSVLKSDTKYETLKD